MAMASGRPIAAPDQIARETCPALHLRLLQTRVKVLLLTNEYPPYTYGGAGVHVEYLSRELAKLMAGGVRCFSGPHFSDGKLTVQRDEIQTAQFTWPKPLRSEFGAVRRCTEFNSSAID